jgi:hypothetical protein
MTHVTVEASSQGRVNQPPTPPLINSRTDLWHSSIVMGVAYVIVSFLAGNVWVWTVGALITAICILLNIWSFEVKNKRYQKQLDVYNKGAYEARVEEQQEDEKIESRTPYLRVEKQWGVEVDGKTVWLERHPEQSDDDYNDFVRAFRESVTGDGEEAAELFVQSRVISDWSQARSVQRTSASILSEGETVDVLRIEVRPAHGTIERVQKDQGFTPGDGGDDGIFAFVNKRTNTWHRLYAGKGAILSGYQRIHFVNPVDEQ